MPKVVKLTPFQPHPHGDSRRACLQQLIENVLKQPLDSEYKRKILHDLLWKYTEADGKHNTRFRSIAAELIAFSSRRELESALRHDHVTSREHLVARLMECPHEQVGAILLDAVACLVTKDEHRDLSRWDKTHPGWSKYSKAEVKYRS